MIIKKFVAEPDRRVPVADEVDILVVWGGIAGSSAAIAASRIAIIPYLAFSASQKLLLPGLRVKMSEIGAN
jgi:hypothetical protein